MCVYVFMLKDKWLIIKVILLRNELIEEKCMFNFYYSKTTK